MKFKKTKIKKYTLFKLYILKYSKIKGENIFNLLNSKLELKFKKLLKIIYEYHVFNKKILFFGLNSTSKRLKKTNHTFLKSLESGFCIAKKDVDLVVIFRHPDLVEDVQFLDKMLRLNVPIILFGDNKKIINTINNKFKSVYKFSYNSSDVNFYKFLICGIIKSKVKIEKLPNLITSSILNDR